MKYKKINTINMNKRDFSITREKGEWYDVRVIDSYGKVYHNYFEKLREAHDWVYFIWEKEEWFNSVNSQELLANAIENCKRLDKNINVREI